MIRISLETTIKNTVTIDLDKTTTSPREADRQNNRIQNLLNDFFQFFGTWVDTDSRLIPKNDRLQNIQHSRRLLWHRSGTLWRPRDQTLPGTWSNRPISGQAMSTWVGLWALGEKISTSLFWSADFRPKFVLFQKTKHTRGSFHAWIRTPRR